VCRHTLYWLSVVCLKRSRLVRALVFALLAWTGVDLAVTQSCAVDRVTVAAAGTAQLTNRADRTPAPSTGDDCFCCSHTVMASTPTPLLAILANHTPVLGPSTAQSSGVGHPLYHPPQLSL